jgi:DNA-binding response OmpR family regulator
MNHVLVVDDEPAIRNLVRMSLQPLHVDVEIASNGKEAIVALNRNRPALIVLDLAMPVMDGRTFFRAIDGQDRPPVLILSSEGSLLAKKELGAEASMAKPFDPEKLASIVEDLMRT